MEVTSTTDPIYMYNYMNQMIMNPTVFIIIFIVILSYLAFFTSLNNDGYNNTNTSSSNMHFIGIIIGVVVLLLIVSHMFQYFFSINVTTYVTDLFTSKPKIDIVVDQTNAPPVPEIMRKNQVFNIPENTYNFTNAKALCSAYGSRLATYKEVEDSYKKGGEWCNYGWSDGQLALFPTQQKTFDVLQNIKGHEQDCGRPGINGGYMKNPELKFGVNCYGKKPRITHDEEELMENTTPYPLTAEDIAFQARVDYWKNKVDEILVSPFNSASWSS